MTPDFAQYGFQWSDNLIMAYIGGSQAHGAKVEGTDDTDWYGVYIEPPGVKTPTFLDWMFVRWELP